MQNPKTNLSRTSYQTLCIQADNSVTQGVTTECNLQNGKGIYGMEKIRWTDHVRNEEVLLRVNEQRNILHEIWKRKANWIGHIFRRNCLLKQVIEGKIKGEMEVTRRRGRRRKKLLDDLNP